jgi:ABC-type multidrug transport system, permease component
MTAFEPGQPVLVPLPRGRTVRLGLSRARYEIRAYFRQGDTVFFTFLFPVVMLAVFSVAFSAMGTIGASPRGKAGVSYAAYYLPGMVAAGILLSGLQNLAVDIAGEKSDGTLKRLAGTPLSVVSYFVGKIGQVYATSFAQLLLLLAVARLAFGVALPTTAGSWLTLLWVYLLGVATSSVLGIALSGLPRTGRSASAVIVPIVLVLQFISGVFLPFTQLPAWLQNIASVFPLKWIAQASRAVFLPDYFAAAEQSGSWQLGLTSIVLGAWLIAGLVLCRLTFRWIRKSENG